MRLMLFDRTCTTLGRLPLGLSHTWVTGGALYRALRRFDAVQGVDSWAEGLRWLHEHPTITDVQFWGHGHWGSASIDRDVLDASALEPGHPLHPAMCRLRDQLAPGARWWFRTCDTLGSQKGHDFAQAWTAFFDRPIAGHTHIIGVWQSGLHQLQPGHTPHWPAREGIAEGTAERPQRSTWSSPRLPNTLNCLQSAVPEGW